MESYVDFLSSKTQSVLDQDNSDHRGNALELPNDPENEEQIQQLRQINQQRLNSVLHLCNILSQPRGRRLPYYHIVLSQYGTKVRIPGARRIRMAVR